MKAGEAVPFHRNVCSIVLAGSDENPREMAKISRDNGGRSLVTMEDGPVAMV